jgi:pilus assembly protein Flp/PilA
MFRFLKRLLRDEDGPTAVEYGMLLALIVLAALGAIESVGSSASTSMGQSNTKMSDAGLGK